MHNKKGEYMYYVNYFFIFSIIGHIIESFFYSNGDGGILFGYWTPVYGVGAVIILLINKVIQKNKIKYNKLVLFISSAIILSAIEVLGGYLIKWAFHKVLWDYSNQMFNIGKYTSLSISLLWGICSLVLIYFLKPVFDKFIKKIPIYISYLLIVMFIIDLSATVLIKGFK